MFLDNNGDGKRYVNEIWRIVGIFKNSDDEWNLKLMKNTVLEDNEIPETYTYNGTSYTLKDDATSNLAYWNKTNTATNYNDWTTTKLGYFLNANDGYGTLSSNIQSIIDTNYTHYLGNHKYEQDTTITAYTNERDKNNIYSGNQPTWNGKVALLYPSDFGYSVSSNYWSETTLFKYNKNAGSTSWMQTNANHLDINEWFLSPTSFNIANVSYWTARGDLLTNGTYYDGYYAIRPVINLNSGANLDINHQSISGDPYLIA